MLQPLERRLQVDQSRLEEPGKLQDCRYTLGVTLPCGVLCHVGFFAMWGSLPCGVLCHVGLILKLADGI